MRPRLVHWVGAVAALFLILFPPKIRDWQGEWITVSPEAHAWLESGCRAQETPVEMRGWKVEQSMLGPWSDFEPKPKIVRLTEAQTIENQKQELPIPRKMEFVRWELADGLKGRPTWYGFLRTPIWVVNYQKLILYLCCLVGLDLVAYMALKKFIVWRTLMKLTDWIVRIAVTLAALMVLFPPWTTFLVLGNGVKFQAQPFGYSFLFLPPTVKPGWTSALDWERLGLQIAALALVAGATYLWARRDPMPKSEITDPSWDQVSPLQNAAIKEPEMSEINPDGVQPGAQNLLQFAAQHPHGEGIVSMKIGDKVFPVKKQ